MKKYVFTIGLTKSKSYRPKFFESRKITVKKAVKIIDQIMFSFGIQSFTVVNCTGFWQGEKEKSLQVVIITENEISNMIVWSLKQDLRQDCIACELSEANFKLM